MGAAAAAQFNVMHVLHRPGMRNSVNVGYCSLTLRSILVVVL